MYKITNANIKDWAKNYDGELFDGILCDPPYELGFMGKSWDSSGIAFDSEMWTGIFKLLKPGGHLLAFSGSRTYHRMAVAIEDAGFEIRDQLIWMYGSGFPKSLNIGKAVNRLQGNERESVGKYEIGGMTPDRENFGANDRSGGKGMGFRPGEIEITKGTSEWEGYGTALKPAHEPCVLARKPLDGTVANNVLKHGTGGLNIDGTRVGTTGARFNGRKVDSDIYGKYGVAKPKEDYNMGRFPANLIHDGSDEVEAVFPQTTKAGNKKDMNKNLDYSATSYKLSTNKNPKIQGDNGGSASRFFYTAKSSKSERNLGLDSTVSIRVQLEICENSITRQENLAQLQVVMDNSHLKATAESGIGTKSRQNGACHCLGISTRKSTR